MLVIHAAEDWITSPPIPSRFREAWQAIGIYSLVKIFACSEISLRVREEYFSFSRKMNFFARVGVLERRQFKCSRTRDGICDKITQSSARRMAGQ
jgi:hypothetical protein